MVSFFSERIAQLLAENTAYRRLLDHLSRKVASAHCSGTLTGAFLAGLIVDISRREKTSALVVLPTKSEAEDFVKDLSLHTERVLLFEEWERALVRGLSPPSSLNGRRVAVLSEILRGSRVIVVASLPALLSYLPPPELFRTFLRDLRVGDEIDPHGLMEELITRGYTRTAQVSVAGECSQKGEVIDFFPPGEEEGVRILFDYDKIEAIRRFHPIERRSTSEKESFLLCPVKENSWSAEAVERLERALTKRAFKGRSPVESLQEGSLVRGEERFFALSYARDCTLWDYLESDTAFFFALHYERWSRVEDILRREHVTLQKEAVCQDVMSPPWEDLFLSLAEHQFKPQRVLYHNDLWEGKEESVRMGVEPGRSFFGDIARSKEEITQLEREGYEVYLFAESETQAERLRLLFRDSSLHIVAAGITAGFFLPDQKLAVIQENEIFGRRSRMAASSSARSEKGRPIDSFVDIHPGDYIVHVHHGIGIFKGIERLLVGGEKRDYISLSYRGEERIFLPVEQLTLLQRYVGQEGRAPLLDQIGGKGWETRKKRVKKAVDDLADKLIMLYASREKIPGYAFPEDDVLQMSFEAAFPYEETPDQLAAIEEVKQDMQKPLPMDRLICGDVGYGKTEVSMRAAFKAILGGRQVAFLCPTTILAEQHYNSFIERFERFPVKTRMLSRFVNRKARQEIVAELSEGEIDLVIGTQCLLSREVSFKNLGLVVIDEEQRFGVKDKERLKEMKRSVDCLTLSATPIPRTLHMSLAKIRTMSILATPPLNRQAIKTFVQEFDPTIVASAIRQEIARGGQIFYLHNHIETLNATRNFLQKLVPEVLIETAYGRIGTTELERVMQLFVHGGCHLLLSTSIIENGINIPNVNTIIIDRADIYGVSQLYQLRGRVGRSGNLAYAYLLYPDKKNLSEMAIKRLQVISDFTELGSGFRVAMRDMEVRGVGDLLGRRQSGDIYAVGFDMYLSLLERALAKKRGEEEKDPPEVYTELNYTGYIPDAYITNLSEKMEIYKKVAAVSHDEERQALERELFDRFGPFPREVQSLLTLTKVRTLCRTLWISSLKEKQSIITITFGKTSHLLIERLMEEIQRGDVPFRPNPRDPESLLLPLEELAPWEKLDVLLEKLSLLCANSERTESSITIRPSDGEKNV